MQVDVVEVVKGIDPYLLAVSVFFAIGLVAVMGKIIFWLVKYIINRHESDNATIITELKDAIENMSVTHAETAREQAQNNREMRDTLHEMSMSAQLMATTLREKIDQSVTRVHERIEKTEKEINGKIDDIHDRITKVTTVALDERAMIKADVATIKGRCDDRARMCPHVRGDGTHCHPDGPCPGR